MHVAIIGNGISGITAARHIRKLSGHQITVISSETPHFFSRPALMYVYMGHAKFEHIKPYEDHFWKKNKIDLIHDFVDNIEFKTKTLHLKSGNEIHYDKLVIAVGAKPNKFGWPGQDLTCVQGLYSYQDLLKMEENTKHINRAVIVGGGLIGVEMAEMLHSRNIPVTFLVREDSFWNIVLPKEESEMINRHILEHHIDLRLNTELKKILPGDNERVAAVVTADGEKISCEFVGITAGVSPNIALLNNCELETNRGILVNEFLETNLDDVYALGDCAEFRQPLKNRRPVEQVWYTGKMMGETVARTICGNKTAYQPGIWFNSAKFFDIEYQTYGWVWPNPKDNETSIYWEHPSGKKCIRIVYDKNNKHVLGFNILGIRLRHETCDKWIKEKTSIDLVLKNFHQACFDPEFYKTYEKELVNKYNQDTGRP